MHGRATVASAMERSQLEKFFITNQLYERVWTKCNLVMLFFSTTLMFTQFGAFDLINFSPLHTAGEITEVF